jgi:hypothetical protein
VAPRSSRRTFKIPALDVALAATSAWVLLAGVLIEALDRAELRATSHPAAPLAALLWVAPSAFASMVLWRAAIARATGWRRAGARLAAIALITWALACALGALEVRTQRRWTHGTLTLALSGLGVATYLTSPARERPRHPRRSR